MSPSLLSLFSVLILLCLCPLLICSTLWLLWTFPRHKNIQEHTNVCLQEIHVQVLVLVWVKTCQSYLLTEKRQVWSSVIILTKSSGSSSSTFPFIKIFNMTNNMTSVKISHQRRPVTVYERSLEPHLTGICYLMKEPRQRNTTFSCLSPKSNTILNLQFWLITNKKTESIWIRVSLNVEFMMRNTSRLYQVSNSKCIFW